LWNFYGNFYEKNFSLLSWDRDPQRELLGIGDKVLRA